MKIRTMKQTRANRRSRESAVIRKLMVENRSLRTSAYNVHLTQLAFVEEMKKLHQNLQTDLGRYNKNIKL